MNCSACLNVIVEDNDYLCCTLGDCGKMYHLLCSGEKNPAHLNRDAWVCPECRCTTKKGGDNTLTPVGFAKRNRDSNVTFRKKSNSKKAELPVSTCEYNCLVPEIRDLRQELADIKKSFGVVISGYEAKLCQSIAVINDYETKLSISVSAIVAYEAKIEQYATQIGALHDVLNRCTINNPENPENPRNTKQASRMQSLTSSSTVLQTQPSILLDRSPQLQCTTQEVSQLKHESLSVDDTSIRKTGKATNGSKQRKKNKSEQHQDQHDVSVSPGLQQTSSNQESQVAVTNENEFNDIATRRQLDTQQWTEVKNKKIRRPISKCGTAGPSVTSLKAVQPRKYLHLWNMQSDVEEVRQYLRDLFPTETCIVEELTTRGDYKSYKLGIPVSVYDACFSVDLWPVNARIKIWVNYRSSITNINKTGGPIVSHQPFRGQPPCGPKTSR